MKRRSRRERDVREEDVRFRSGIQPRPVEHCEDPHYYTATFASGMTALRIMRPFLRHSDSRSPTRRTNCSPSVRASATGTYVSGASGDYTVGASVDKNVYSSDKAFISYGVSPMSTISWRRGGRSMKGLRLRQLLPRAWTARAPYEARSSDSRQAEGARSD